MGQIRITSSEAKVLADLSAAETKPRAGLESLAERFVALVQKKPDALQIKGFDAEATLNELRACRYFDGVIAGIKRALALAQEMRRSHESNVWRVMFQVYQQAEAAAPDDPEIQQAVLAFESFVKSRSCEAQ
jgi:hypothetical protein